MPLRRLAGQGETPLHFFQHRPGHPRIMRTLACYGASPAVCWLTLRILKNFNDGLGSQAMAGRIAAGALLSTVIGAVLLSVLRRLASPVAWGLEEGRARPVGVQAARPVRASIIGPDVRRAAKAASLIGGAIVMFPLPDPRGACGHRHAC
jgi:hypothetical protein